MLRWAKNILLIQFCKYLLGDVMVAPLSAAVNVGTPVNILKNRKHCLHSVEQRYEERSYLSHTLLKLKSFVAEEVPKS